MGRLNSSTASTPMRSLLLRLLWLILLAALLYWAFQNAPLAEIWLTIGHLRFWQLASLIGINAGIYALVALRWWIVTQADAKQVPYFPLLAVRVAVFGVSYFTLGPQVGGEPLQVLALRHRYNVSYTRAASIVVMDKLLEFLANFVLLAIGLTSAIRADVLPLPGGRVTPSLIGLMALLIWPAVHIGLLRRGIHPLTSLMRLLPPNRVLRFLIASERLASMFCQRHFRELLASISVSLLAAFGMVTEYVMIVKFLHLNLTAAQTIAAWTAGWLSFLVPWPGGLGALEASQVFALGTFGVSTAAAIGVTLVIRTRDLLIGSLGLLLASLGMTKQRT